MLDDKLPLCKIGDSGITAYPLVSIVTPVLNDIKYLEESIQNVLKQSYPYIEHFLIDGGSTDGTTEMLFDYQKKYPGRISFISEPDNGVGEALNKGLKMSKGEIIGWQDSDDLYMPEAVMTAVNYFNGNPDVYYLFGGCHIIDETGKTIGKLPINDYNFKSVVRGEDYFSLTTAFFRRQVVEEVGYFNTVGNDLDYWIRIAQKYKMHRIDKTLCAWRIHTQSVGFSKNKRSVEMISQKLYQDYLLCRKYGGRGSLLAPRCWKYLLYKALNSIGLFQFLNVSIRLRLRRYRVVSFVLRLFSA